MNPTDPRPDAPWTRYKTFAFIAQGLAVAGLIAILLIPFWGVDPKVHIALANLIGVAVWPVHVLGKRNPLQRQPSPEPRLPWVRIAWIGAGVALAAAVGLAAARLFDAAAATMLVSTLMAYLAFHLKTRPPTPREAWRDDLVLWLGRGALTTHHALGVPAGRAVFALGLAMGGLWIVHAGAALFADAQSVLPLVPCLAIAAGAIAVAQRWAMRPDVPPTWQETAPPAHTSARAVLVGSATLAAIVLVLATVIAVGKGPFAPERWIDAVAIAVLVASGPYGFLMAHRARQIRALEARFPDFLRDLAAGRQAGLTLEASVRMTTRGDYGALSADIRRLSAQLAWNLSFEEALARLAERVRTPLIARSTSLIIEASRSGGHVSAVLQAAADDARRRRHLEEERRGHMTVYTGVIHIGFLVFLGVAAILYISLVPRLVEVSQSMGGQTAAAGLTVVQGISVVDYRTFYFVGSLSQAIGNGLFAGLVATGRLLNGLQHVFYMVAAAALVFLAVGTP